MKITNNLRERVITTAAFRITKLHEKRLAKINDPTWGQRIYDILFADEKDMLAKIPQYWFELVNNIYIKSACGKNYGAWFPLPSLQPWPRYFPRTDIAEVVTTPHSLNLKKHPVWDELVAYLDMYYGRVNELNEEKRFFVDSIANILYKCSTFEQAVAAWPPLRDFVPDECITAKRKPKSVSMEGFQLDKMTAIATAIKLGV